MKGVYASKPLVQNCVARFPNRVGVHVSHPGAPRPFIQKRAARRPNGDGWGFQSAALHDRRG